MLSDTELGFCSERKIIGVEFWKQMVWVLCIQLFTWAFSVTELFSDSSYSWLSGTSERMIGLDISISSINSLFNHFISPGKDSKQICDQDSLALDSTDFDIFLKGHLLSVCPNLCFIAVMSEGHPGFHKRETQIRSLLHMRNI